MACLSRTKIDVSPPLEPDTAEAFKCSEQSANVYSRNGTACHLGTQVNSRFGRTLYAPSTSKLQLELASFNDPESAVHGQSIELLLFTPSAAGASAMCGSSANVSTAPTAIDLSTGIAAWRPTETTNAHPSWLVPSPGAAWLGHGAWNPFLSQGEQDEQPFVGCAAGEEGSPPR